MGVGSSGSSGSSSGADADGSSSGSGGGSSGSSGLGERLDEVVSELWERQLRRQQEREQAAAARRRRRALATLNAEGGGGEREEGEAQEEEEALEEAQEEDALAFPGALESMVGVRRICLVCVAPAQSDDTAAALSYAAAAARFAFIAHTLRYARALYSSFC